MEDQTSGAIFDDSQVLLDVLAIIFRDYPEYKFSYFIDGNVFLKSVTDQLELALIDIHAPNFNVVEAVKTIREKSKACYIIVMSADRDWDVLLELHRLGIMDYCDKGSKDFGKELLDAVKLAHEKIQLKKGA